jgi:hypothetical protein
MSPTFAPNTWLETILNRIGATYLDYGPLKFRSDVMTFNEMTTKI